MRTENVVSKELHNRDPNGEFTVWVDPIVNTVGSPTQKLTFGHEWFHINDRRSGDFDKWAKTHGVGIAKVISEMRAYEFNLSLYPNDDAAIRKHMDYENKLRDAGIDPKQYSLQQK